MANVKGKYCINRQIDHCKEKLRPKQGILLVNNKIKVKVQ
jgi:hypothetical protein